MDNAQSILQTPAEQVRIARRNDDAGPAKILRRRDQGLHIRIGLTHNVPEVVKPGSIACNSTMPFDNKRCTLTDAITQFARAALRRPR